MSSNKRDEMVKALGFAISRWQDAVETFDETVGAIYKLNGPERRCLSFVSHGAQTASAIAKDVGLTPAAVTSLLDRMEGRGFVKRLADPNDRRKVMVEAGAKTRELIEHAYIPVFEAGAKLLSRYSLAEMKLIHQFVEEVTAMQQQRTEAIRHDKPQTDAAET